MFAPPHSYPRSLLLLGAVAAVTFAVGLCLGALHAESDDDPSSEALVSIGGEIISRAEIEAAAASNLENVEMTVLQCQAQANQSRHQALVVAIETMVRERLIEAAAIAAGQDETAWLAAMRVAAEAEISDEQVDSWYEENRARLSNTTKEQVAGQIRGFLASEALIEKLREQSDVKIFLEPYRVDVVPGPAPIKGGAEAPVIVVEFSDFQCPYCEKLTPTLREVTQHYGDRIQLSFRHYPVAGHANARKAAEASMCAAEQGQFWPMHDLMFAEQQQLEIANLKEKATRLEMDTEAFNTCLDSGKYAELVQEDFRAGVLAGVSGTPAVFVNGRLISGLVPFAEMAKIIDDELERLGVASE